MNEYFCSIEPHTYRWLVDFSCVLIFEPYHFFYCGKMMQIVFFTSDLPDRTYRVAATKRSISVQVYPVSYQLSSVCEASYIVCIAQKLKGRLSCWISHTPMNAMNYLGRLQPTVLVFGTTKHI